MMAVIAKEQPETPLKTMAEYLVKKQEASPPQTEGKTAKAPAAVDEAALVSQVETLEKKLIDMKNLFDVVSKQAIAHMPKAEGKALQAALDEAAN